jgi:hypothetical protein
MDRQGRLAEQSTADTTAAYMLVFLTEFLIWGMTAGAAILTEILKNANIDYVHGDDGREPHVVIL